MKIIPTDFKLALVGWLTVEQAGDQARSHFKNTEKFAGGTEVGSFKDIAENWIKRRVEKRRGNILPTSKRSRSER